jgi:hypothetical protein
MKDNERCQGGGGCCDGPEKHSGDDSSQETCPVLSSRRSRQEGGFAGCANARESCGAATPGLEKDLLSETLKWQGKAEDLFAKVCGDGQFLENISAYIADSRYFLEKNDLIRAFEAVIWAWAWMEIGLLKGILQERK